MALLDDLRDWTSADAAVLALGRALGVFGGDTTAADARAVLLTNSAAGNTLTGVLARLVRLGVLEHDEEAQRYRAGGATLHAFEADTGVPALEAGPPARAYLRLVPDTDGVRLEADRAGLRYLAVAFDELADSGLEPGARFVCDARFGAAEGAALTLLLVDPGSDDPA